MLRVSLVLAALFCLLVSGCVYYTGGGDRVHDTSRQSIPVLANAHVSIENVAGRILVEPWDNNVVDMVAVKHADNPDDLGHITIEVTRDATPASSVEIQTHYVRQGFLFGDSGGTVDYTVHVPRGAQLRLVTVSGDITANGFANNLSASDVSGDVSTERINGSLFVHTVSGSIDASLVSMGGNRNATIQTISGDVRLAVPHDSSAVVNAHSISGDLHSDFPLNIHSQTVGTDADGRIGDGSGSIDLSSISGSLHLNSLTAGR